MRPANSSSRLRLTRAGDGARYLFATLLSLYNKWMFSPAYYGFSYPLFVTMIHMFVQFCLAGLVRTVWAERYRPKERPTLRDYGCVSERRGG